LDVIARWLGYFYGFYFLFLLQ